MKKERSPFIFHDGQWFVLPTFENKKPSANLLRETLKGLLERHPPESILILRRMSPAEVGLLKEYWSSLNAEVFAVMCSTPERRLGKKTKRQTKKTD